MGSDRLGMGSERVGDGGTLDELEGGPWTIGQVNPRSVEPGLDRLGNPGLARECIPVHAAGHEHGDPDRFTPPPALHMRIGPRGETFVASDLVAAMDDRSRKLLGRSDLERRIRLVPRSLMIADLLGLSLAYVITTLCWGRAAPSAPTKEMLIFCATLPCWLVVARLQGLYRADQEHADHSTADDIVKVFYLVTIGVWMLLVASRLFGRTSPSIYALITFWAIAIVPSCRWCGPSPAACARDPAPTSRTR